MPLSPENDGVQDGDPDRIHLYSDKENTDAVQASQNHADKKSKNRTEIGQLRKARKLKLDYKQNSKYDRCPRPLSRVVSLLTNNRSPA